MHKAEFGLVEGSLEMKLVEQTALEPGEREKVIGGVEKDAFWLENIPCQPGEPALGLRKRKTEVVEKTALKLKVYIAFFF